MTNAVAGALCVALCAAAAGLTTTADAAPRARAHGYDVSKRAGWQVWSVRGGDGAFRLRLRRGTGRSWLSAVRPNGDPFAVDLGTDAAGRTVAVYARCAGGRCRVAALDPRTAHAWFLPIPPFPAGDRTPQVSLHRGVVTYAFTVGAWSTIKRVRADGSRPPRIVLEKSGVVTHLDTGPRGLAYVVVEPEPDVAHASASVLLRRLGARRSRRVGGAAYGEEGGTEVVSLAFSGRRLVWGLTGSDANLVTFGQIAWHDLRTGRSGDRRAPGGWLFSAAPDETNPVAPMLLAYAPHGNANADAEPSDREILRRVSGTAR